MIERNETLSETVSDVQYGFPADQGLYSSENEKDSCGVGFVAHIKGERSRQIVDDADRILRHMTHRGACGCEANTGDGAGMLTSLPTEFFAEVVKEELGVTLPEKGKYGAGIVFLPQDPAFREECRKVINDTIVEQGQKLICWRPLPTDAKLADIGPSAVKAEPHMEMLFIGAADGLTQDQLDLQLYIIRKISSHKLRLENLHPQALMNYICSLSTKIIIYKGMLTPDQVLPYYKDLRDPRYMTHLAMVHSRFSTNTFPSWDRAQPLRYMAHNGEINTVRGNKNWLNARQGLMQSEFLGEDLKKLFPIAERFCSDSGSFDNALELLMYSGRTLPEVMMMMIPEAWQNRTDMADDKRAFYEYYSALQEPWDGPASVSFTDGHYIGATLDRNGLRPSRYYLTHDDKVVMASEVGVLDIEPDNVKFKGRLQPGKMFLVDFEQGRIIDDEELKHSIAKKRPYREWLNNQRLELGELPHSDIPHDAKDDDDLLVRMMALGFTIETLNYMLLPMIREKRDPINSMGDDAALACLSDKPRPLYDYFKQLFAQVTNPPIDSIREEVIMSLECFIGPEQNLLESTEEHCHRLNVPHPILTNEEMSALKHLDYRGWKSRTIDITFPRAEGPAGLKKALARICEEVEQAIADKCSIVVLSDREMCYDRVAMPTLLACGAVHHDLVRKEMRTRIGIVLESGEAREVHHHCVLTGYGADAINPYMAFAAIKKAQRDGDLEGDWTDKKVVEAYRKAVAKGMLKVMGKMGISTLASYKGAQIFEAVGLAKDVIETAFVGTPSRIKGIDLELLGLETIKRHELGYPPREQLTLPVLPNLGLYNWRKEGEKHAWNPYTISTIQAAARTGDKNAYKQFSDLVNTQTTKECHLRGILQFKENARTPVPLDEVESTKEIVKRFCTGAMSYGSISLESHQTLAIAMNQIGGKSNTGEGGEEYSRFEPFQLEEQEHENMLKAIDRFIPGYSQSPEGQKNHYSKRSAIKQIASGRFGVTSWYLTNADELQIKIAQGAKPGEGGELPGHKVDKVIAATRHSTPGVGLISPPPHHDIYSIEDLSQLIFDLKNSNPSARISVKLVSEVGVGTIAAGVAKGHADNILIAGDSGGTGASPLTSIKHAGLPWELGIAETHQTLVLNDLRSRVRLQTDGQLKTGRDVVMACMLGAEEFGFATAPLIAVGCIMMRKCHLNTCPVGIATQDPELRKKFNGKPEHVINYLFLVAEEAREIMAKLGFRTIEEMVGHSEMLELNPTIEHWKAKHLDLTSVITPPVKPHAGVQTYCTKSQDHALEATMDQVVLIPRAKKAIEDGQSVDIETKIQNIDRAFGTTLSHEISKRWGVNGLPENTVKIKCHGSAGQSVGAWLVKGVTIEVEGDCNDYVGKGLSGGRIVVYKPKDSTFEAADNIIAGNVCLYGATSGEVFMSGTVAERFCVRNSGATAVVEGVGDHGLEYMTGGVAVILGETGRNFAAGMSGGVAYVLEPRGTFQQKCNMETIELETIHTEDPDADELHKLVMRHHQFTGSEVAADLLEDWDASLSRFTRVMPVDYKRALKELAKSQLQASAH
jgi:glutamate synthase (NADPH/NADH) large chain